MSGIELKEKLINSINKTDNEELLHEVYRLLEIENEDIEIYKLSDEQCMAISKSQQQIKNGEFITNQEADNEIEEWLKS
jgi:CRISPR/Cas system-associated endoribonuclease Cas2